MNKKNIVTRILSCLLVLCLLMSSVFTVSMFQDTRAEEQLTYVLKSFSYPNDSPIYWKYPNYSAPQPLFHQYYRGASANDPTNFSYVAYCMDWGKKGPASEGSTYDHVTTTISQEKINQLTYVMMNGYSGSDNLGAKNNTFTLTNKYGVNRYGRSLTLTDDGGTGTMCMQMATQIATWLVMGKDSEGRVMKLGDERLGYVECQNLDYDIFEMAETLYKEALKHGSEIDWLSVNIDKAETGVYDKVTSSKLYGPFIASSDFTKNNLKVSLKLSSNAPAGTKILDESKKEITNIDVGKRFYISIPADAKDSTVTVGLTREMGRVLPLSYEEETETRQRMFFSSLSSAATTLAVEHSQSDASLTIHKQVNDASPEKQVSLSSAEGYTFLVYYLKDAKSKPHYLGDFETDANGKIQLTGLTPGIYQVVEAMNYEQEKAYESIVVKGFTDANGKQISKGEDYQVLPNTSNGVVSFEIKASGLEKNYNLYFLNQRHDKTRITITKIDQYTGEYVSDAHFKVYKMTPNGSGGYTYAKDENGNYIIYEGYTYDDSMGQVIFGRTENNAGSRYQPVDVVFTNGEVLEQNNTYRVVEITPPNGYVGGIDMKFHITENEVNKVIALYNFVDTYTDSNGIEREGYYITNRPFVNALKVTKYEKGTTNPIAGVKFAIYEKVYGEYNFVTTITTDKNGVAQYGYDKDGNIDVKNGNALIYGREYYISETYAPDGYVIDSTLVAVPHVVTDGEVIEMTIENEKEKDGSFKVVKTNNDKEPLSDTEFTLYKIKDEYTNAFDEFFISYKGLHTVEDSDYKYLSYFLDNNLKVDLTEVQNYIEKVGTYKTNESGIIQQTVQKGEYILLETKSQSGYNILNTIYRFGVYNSSSHYVLECVNDPIVGSVKLLKTNSNNGEYISGVEFTLYQKNNVLSAPDIKIGTYETDKNGSIFVTGLEYGEYYFLETKTPDRFEKPEDAETKDATKFIIDVNGEIESIAYTNVEKPCSVVVYKTEKGTDTPIAGAKFALMKDNNKVAEAITDKDGVATFTGLELGEYTLVELATAPGYDINSFSPLTITVDNYSVHKVFANNEKIKANIKILKVDKDTELPLNDVEFSLYSSNDLDNALRTLKTNEDGVVVFEDVEFGDYVVVETKTLNGYKISENKTLIKVEEDKEYFYTIANEMIKRNIKLIKVDKDTTIPIANVEFDVYALVGDEYVKYSTVTTDENGECNFVLPFGEYELRETKSGKGYRVSNETTKIDLTTDDIEDILQITITNELIKNKITVRKSGDEVGNYLAGAKYGLYDLATDQLILEGVTDENGIFCFGTVSYGSYYLKEIEAPEGYTLSSDVHNFVVDENSPEEQIIDVVDTAVPQTDFSSNMLLMAFFMTLSACLFIAIVVLETKARAKAYNQ